MTPQELKESILLQAFQGKLVPHTVNEGTGKEVLLTLQNELLTKLHLGLIKKSKIAPECSESEIDFDLPENWGIAKLGYVCQLLDGEKRSSQNYPYLEARYLRGKVDPTVLSNGKYVPAKTNVILVDGENSGEVFTLSEEGYMGSTFKVLFIPECLSQKYVIYFLMLHRNTLRNNKRGSAIPHLNKDIFFSLPLPIPPLAEQKRIVAKIEEILPLIDRYEAAWRRLEEFNKRFPGDMQKSILQLAIQGKLVEQRPEEGTGEELFQQIQAEKQALIKSGKIKKEKQLSAISDDEIPFDIPDTWKWVRLNDLVSVLGDGIHGTPIFDETGTYYFVNGNNLVKGSIVFKADTKKVSVSEYEKHKKPLDENTILISINGTIGNYAFYANEPIILGKSACYFSVLTGVNKEYIRHLLNTKWFMDYAVKEATQTTIKNVSLKAMRMFPVPLPPLAEQKRIVAKLEEILPLCDRLK